MQETQPAPAVRDGYHHGDLRAALLDAATEMLEAGASFSLRAVARHANVSQSAPYRHFADREALESALAVRGFHELRGRLSQGGRLAASEAELTEFAVAYVGFALQHPAVFRLMFGQPCDDRNDERVLAAGELHTLLEDSISQVYAHIDPAPLATALWALTHGLAFLHLDGKLTADSPEAVAVRVRDAIAAIRALPTTPASA
ncbi:AcrR family transcriptional regulator [Microbacterium terrae]|uniref:DNA-binding transcriptional repressor FabR n=1 Tax=Microbacterium terrae TaxID=69369 RepID=A0A0M2H2A0_9MICO|nr:TetR/AcrR family transcriptional regulator [Microbacterium terrae]KJL38367.1 DNA-binding transcriptional repressor FabR [Microbacterium terrae]MBP1078992.1 AcrR family transcriptional regulator [Microbacterium terrae]GLJ98392.1 TetR family transcriptional regulator [Microbacterium terrae]